MRMYIRKFAFALRVIPILLVSCTNEGGENDTISHHGIVNETNDFSSYSTIYHVSARGSDVTGDGSRESPFASPHGAMEKAIPASENSTYAICVSEGVYECVSLKMQKYVDLFGGFDSLSWERKIEKNKTLLIGDGSSRILIGNNHARLDGFFITGGRFRGNGGAIYCEGTSPEISNNYFYGNSTLAPLPWQPKFIHEKAHDGGAVYAEKGASPIIRNNVFAWNETGNGRGGAIALHDHCGGVIRNNVFLHNVSGRNDNFRSSDGGGVSVFNWCKPEIRDNLFIGNKALAKNDAGGLFIALWSSPLVENNYFLNNEAMDDAGALFVGGQEHRYDSPLDPLPPASDFFVKVTGNVFMGNKNPSKNSGAMRFTMEGRGEFSNNLVAFNNGIYFQRSDVEIANNIIIDNFLLMETKEGLNPCRLRNNIILGKINLETEVEISQCITLDGEGDKDTSLKFADDGIMLRILGVMVGDQKTETRLIVADAYPANSLKNKIVRSGSRFTVIKGNRGNEIVLWDDFSSEKEFEVLSSYSTRSSSTGYAAGVRH